MNNIQTYNESCIVGMRRIESNSIDLVFTDPPYGLDGSNMDKHYNRDSSKVISGYVDIDSEDYLNFTEKWMTQCFRCLKPGGSIYIVSGYSNLRHILNALHLYGFEEVNHLIAEYTFGVFTSKKWVSSHYHILFYVKPPDSKRIFNTFCRTSSEQTSYQDRLSVQKLKREYKKNEVRNVNQLSVEFVSKYILYSSNENDLVLDPFAGSFSTGLACLNNNRNFIGFEINKECFDYFVPKLKLNNINEMF